MRRIEITEIRYVVQQNNLTIDLEPVAIHWGPEGAAAVDPGMGVERLAVLPALPSNATPMGNADIDAVGALFTEDARYLRSPVEPAAVGHQAITTSGPTTSAAPSRSVARRSG